MKIPRCKGARDLMPQEMQKFSHLKRMFRASCAGWGYQEVRTPTLEYLHLFTSAGTLTPEMLSRVYSFLDWDGWSGERVVLRPDGTIPAARLFVECMADQPVARLCYIENMFSFEGTGQESRERWQCGVELIGGKAPEADAELVMLSLEVLEKLFVAPVNVKISHVGFFRTLLEELGIPDEQREEYLRSILGGNADVLAQIEGQSDDVQRFLTLLSGLQGKSLGFLANLKALLPRRLAAIGPQMDDLAQVAELLDAAGQDYEIDFTAGEGFEYYTGIGFQFYCQDRLIGNGGRYDKLIGLVGGSDVPASGFALLVDRVLAFMPDVDEAVPDVVQLRRADSSRTGMKPVFEAARLLRDQGCVVELDVGLGERSGCRWVVSVEDGMDASSLSLLDGRTGREKRGLSAEGVIHAIGGQA